MVEASFRPSQIHAYFPNSQLGKGEKEAIAAAIVHLLAHRGNEWREFALSELIEFAQGSRSLAKVAYESYFGDPFLGYTLRRLAEMIRGGLLSQREGGRFLTVQEPLLAFYASYVS